MGGETVKDEIVFGYKMANFLLGKGFNIRSIKPHKTQAGLLVFHFINKEGLKESINEYKQLYSKQQLIQKENEDGERDFIHTNN